MRILHSKFHICPERSRRILNFVAAAIIYSAFAIYLYYPYLKNFSRFQYLLPANSVFAALGCYALSRRWVASFAGSFFAGAIYGFGPFMLGLGAYHPTAGFLAAAIPWLFCPAAFGPKNKWRLLQVPLCVLPFLAVTAFFQLSAHLRLFPVPIQARLGLADMGGLVAPLVTAKQSLTFIGFYHIPLAALVIGISMLIAARRFGIIIIFAIGTVLAFCDSVLDVSPVIWLAIPTLCCSVLCGAGIQALAWAGAADRKWILATIMIMATFAIITLLLATEYFQSFAGLADKYAKLFVQTAKMYILGAITSAIIFFTARAKLRLHWLRWVVLGSAMTVDIFLGARFIVDKIF